ncbi:hypothetical protein C9374_008908 [Naegleria lovaniensis]|uniref:5'-nucleotidase n=1 Tax=Naegleria lovaniensis TaxID=51637 RepID=A0AA88GFX6_NAELO|nr:uncharacterized protein C9374_008908 [Naegleria lovaniensis]KAG2377823.1 hypothetical protein C9374_008908 [Naegleria lovaniensis]
MKNLRLALPSAAHLRDCASTLTSFRSFHSQVATHISNHSSSKYLFKFFPSSFTCGATNRFTSRTTTCYYTTTYLPQLEHNHSTLSAITTTTSHFEKVTKPISILMINDVYEFNESPDDGVGGFIGLVKLLNKLIRHEKRLGHPTIVTINGDFLSAGLLSNAYKGKHMVDLFNIMPIDLVTIGNHDFDYGLDVLIQRVRESKFKWICSNVELLDQSFKQCCEVSANTVDAEPPPESEVLLYRKHVMTFPLNNNELRVGFFGILTPQTSILTNGLKNDMHRIKIHPVMEVAKKMCVELKHIDKCDLIICLSHLDMKEDLELSSVKYLDVILGGHTHYPFIEINNTNNTLIVKSGSDAKYVGKMSLVVEKSQRNQYHTKIYVDNVGLILNRDSNETPLSDEDGDESVKKMKNLIHHLNSQIPKDAYDVLAVCESSLSSATSYCRFRESTFGNLVCDILKVAYDADLAVFNGGGIRGDKTYAVNYHMKVIDVMKEFPLINEILSVTIKGKYIRKFVELCLAPMNESGGYASGLYPQVSKGVQIIYDRTKEPNHRIISFEINGKPLEDDKYYKFATTNYLLEGGLDGENWLKFYTYDNEDRIKINTDDKYYMTSLVEVIKEELRKMGTINVSLENRTMDVNTEREES